MALETAGATAFECCKGLTRGNISNLELEEPETEVIQNVNWVSTIIESTITSTLKNLSCFFTLSIGYNKTDLGP
jgi:hypothetical protein